MLVGFLFQELSLRTNVEPTSDATTITYSLESVIVQLERNSRVDIEEVFGALAVLQKRTCRNIIYMPHVSQRVQVPNY